MPALPLKPCAQAGCSRLVRSGRCEEHTTSSTWGRFRRDPSSDRFYRSTAWRNARAAQLRREPWCRVCGVRATTVDHIAAFRLDGGDPLDPSNLQSLCRRHHDVKSANERNARR
jgi:5-methylcytosine-specific restriction enzyme A